MNKKRKILVVSGSRSEWLKIRSICLSLREKNNIELKIVTTGQNNLKRFGSTYKDIEKDGFKIDYQLLTNIEGDVPLAMVQSVGNGINQVSVILEKEKPDIMLVGCDRFEILSAAVAAQLSNVVIAHCQGGERSGTVDENIRHMITKASHVHFPATEKSRLRLIQMGENPDLVFNYGCPFVDYVNSIKINKNKWNFIEQNFSGFDFRLPYGIVIQHPVVYEYKEAYTQMVITLEALQDVGMQCLLVWPNSDPGAEEVSRAVRETMQYYDDKCVIKEAWRTMSADLYLNLLYHADFLVGNSSSGIRESFIFGVPTINIGSRQNGRERTKNIIDVGHDQKQIADAIKSILGKRIYDDNLYGNGTAGQQIADKLATIDLKGLLEKRFHDL